MIEHTTICVYILGHTAGLLCYSLWVHFKYIVAMGDDRFSKYAIRLLGPFSFSIIDLLLVPFVSERYHPLFLAVSAINGIMVYSGYSLGKLAKQLPLSVSDIRAAAGLPFGIILTIIVYKKYLFT